LEKPYGKSFFSVLSLFLLVGILIGCGGGSGGTEGISGDAAGEYWYVRPAEGEYGNNDGTSYENAWSGLLNVVWGSGGVGLGDTLWICGLQNRCFVRSRQELSGYLEN